ncbi:MAG: DUF481 domain-containing protein [Candidatus Omnitrophota bacterium]
MNLIFRQKSPVLKPEMNAVLFFLLRRKPRILVQGASLSFFILLLILIYPVKGSCEELYLKNGDKISGKIVKQDKESIVLETRVFGEVKIKKEFLDHIAGKEQVGVVEPEKIEWKKDIDIGYDKTSGNTKNSHFSTRLFINRKTSRNEFTSKADVYYSSADNKMDSQKWYGLNRYAFSFSKNKKWYNFYKFEADHDRFADIDYRLIPAAGLGFWFADNPGWKALLECGIGYEYTAFRQEAKSQGEMILIPRGFAEKNIFENLKISQEIIFYPAVDDFEEYRFHSESALVSAINKKLALSLSFIDDFNSRPKGGVKKNDSRFITSLVYSF